MAGKPPAYNPQEYNQGEFGVVVIILFGVVVIMALGFLP